MSVPELARVIDVWVDQTEELGRDHAWVAIFENKGEMMGCSNPHPHGQIWATDVLPSEVATEDRCLAEYRREHGTNMLVDYAALEAEVGTRTVVKTDDWIAVVPFWATWPFETLLLPRRHVPRLTDLEGPGRRSLAHVLGELCIRYDNLFETEFPYSMGWHGAPFDGSSTDHWQVHAHFYPPLLRSASVRKFMVGYEMLAEAQRDITPEAAAERLRSVGSSHYKASGPEAVARRRRSVKGPAP